MTPEEIAEMDAIEAAEAEGEIRQRHQPILHAGSPCPAGFCCTCGARPCDAGTLLVMLDKARCAGQGAMSPE